jgi:hypothetical protein
MALSKPISISGVDKPGNLFNTPFSFVFSYVLAEDIAERSVEHFLAACLQDRLRNIYISYNKEISSEHDEILLFLRDYIVKEKGLKSYAVDFKAPHGDQYRILISLHKKEDQEAIKLERFLTYRGKDGLRYTLDVEQEAMSYKEASENGKPRIVIKKMPDFAGPKLVYKLCCNFVLKDCKHSRTFMLGLESLAYLKTMTGLPCKMMITIAVPHEDDPGMESLPSIFSLNPRRSTAFVFGSTRHICEICREHGHRAEVHDIFQAGNRKAKTEESSKAIADKGGCGKAPAPAAEESVASHKRTTEADPKEALLPEKDKSGET